MAVSVLHWEAENAFSLHFLSTFPRAISDPHLFNDNGKWMQTGTFCYAGAIAPLFRRQWNFFCSFDPPFSRICSRASRCSECRPFHVHRRFAGRSGLAEVPRLFPGSLFVAHSPFFSGKRRKYSFKQHRGSVIRNGISSLFCPFLAGHFPPHYKGPFIGFCVSEMNEEGLSSARLFPGQALDASDSPLFSEILPFHKLCQFSSPFWVTMSEKAFQALRKFGPRRTLFPFFPVPPELCGAFWTCH